MSGRWLQAAIGSAAVAVLICAAGAGARAQSQPPFPAPTFALPPGAVEVPPDRLGTGPVERPSYDCKFAKTPDEFAICGNSDLARLDRKMADAYVGDIGKGVGVDWLKATRDVWMSQRRQCGFDVACIRASYVRRIAELSEPNDKAATALPPTERPAAPYAIDGVGIDSFVETDGDAYKALKCWASDDFPGFKWCSRRDALKRDDGTAADQYVTMLHSGTNQAALLVRDISPADFAPGAINSEIQRLSRAFRQTARLFNAKSSVAEVGQATMAVWGDVRLTPLEGDKVDALRRGETIHAGLVVDFLGDPKRSATLGLPIFRIGGGPGYIYAAQVDDSGKGRLRLAAVDASLLPGAAAPHPPAPSPTPTHVVTPRPTPTQTPSVVVKPNPPDPQAVVFDRRVALVIGNFDYRGFGLLPNPRKDAALVADTLKRRGFKSVTLLLDADREKIAKAVNQFTSEAADADWAVVYYAGHGMEMKGVNYLLPTDVKLKQELDVQDEAISLDRILEAVKAGRSLGLVVLDSCRDNPFAKTMASSGAHRSVSRGLTVPETPAGIAVLYAAEAGHVASDGTGEHSPFTTALVNRINEPGLDVALLPTRVAADVLDATYHEQRPFQYGSFVNREPLYFTPPASKPTRAAQSNLP